MTTEEDIGFVVNAVLVADDARLEHTGKEIFIGVYSDEIATREYPAKYSFVLIPLFQNNKVGEFQIAFEVRSSDKLLTSFKVNLNAPRLGYGQVPIRHEFGIDEPSVVDYLVSVNGSEFRVVRRLNFVEQVIDQQI